MEESPININKHKTKSLGDPMHSSMPDSSPIADEDMGMTDPDCDIDT